MDLLSSSYLQIWSKQINDTYLSHVHQVRNANKALLRAAAQAEVEASAAAARYSQLSTDQIWIGREQEEEEQDDDSQTIMSTSTNIAAAAAARAAGDDASLRTAFGLHASDSAVLSHYPTPLLRLLVLLGPIIRAAVRLVQLATWTGGQATASHSFILVLCWWAVCLYGYEVVRYCPQFALLALLFATGIGRAFKNSQGQRSAKNSPQTAAISASANTINATIDNLAILADFFSTLYASLIAPIIALLSWHDVEQTLSLAVFLFASWPVWLLLFSGSLAQLWDIFNLPLVTASFYNRASEVIHTAQPYIQGRIFTLLLTLRIKYPASEPYINTAVSWTSKVLAFIQAYVLPRLYAFALFLSNTAPDSLRLSAGPHVGFFPILALRVRHLLLIVGTIALTWCSPWCALIRHALWRSALVRQSVRLTWACLSGQIFFGRGSAKRALYGGNGYGRLSLGPNGEPITLGGADGDDDAISLLKGGEGVSAAAKQGKSSSSSSNNVTRHEDVVYQFTIFENQRWWMGLDWTAALLPQERPSWADESNNPVSPPSSFSLPPPKVTLKPSSIDKKKYTKRVVRWQWIDPEWTVAGRDASLHAANGGASSADASARNARRASTASVASGLSAASDTNPSGTGGDLLADPSWLDVDAEGWQYGDNAWEKMSKKAGMGRYTRRRRWIRRAVLVELVQTDYLPTSEELIRQDSEVSTATSSLSNKSNSNKTTNTNEASVVNKDALRDRLARAASNGASVGSVQESKAIKEAPASPSAEITPGAGKE